MASNTNKDYTQMHIKASDHPKAYAPHILILNIVMSILGAIIGLELIVRTGVAPNTSIVGALFAIIISRLPIAFLKKYQSIHCQNMIQTSISGATFSAANCFLLPIGVPVIMGRMDLMYPMLVGAFLATIIDATILYKTFDSEMFPAEGAWPPGVASAESILAVVEKGKKALLLIVGMVIGIGGKMIGIPTDLLGVSWFGDFAAMTALGVGSIVIGIIKTNGFIIDIFGHSFPVITNIFGEGADLMASNMFKYMPHGIMIGAGLVSLIQCGRMLFKKSDGDSAAGKFTSSMANMKKALRRWICCIPGSSSPSGSDHRYLVRNGSCSAGHLGDLLSFCSNCFRTYCGYFCNVLRMVPWICNSAYFPYRRYVDWIPVTSTWNSCCLYFRNRSCFL